MYLIFHSFLNRASAVSLYLMTRTKIKMDPNTYLTIGIHYPLPIPFKSVNIYPELIAPNDHILLDLRTDDISTSLFNYTIPTMAVLQELFVKAKIHVVNHHSNITTSNKLSKHLFRHVHEGTHILYSSTLHRSLCCTPDPCSGTHMDIYNFNVLVYWIGMIHIQLMDSITIVTLYTYLSLLIPRSIYYFTIYTNIYRRILQ